MANLPQFVAGTVLTADALNTTLADAVTAGAEQGALNVQAQANTFAEPQTFDAAIVQSASAGVNNQSALMNTADAFSDFIANGMQWAIPSSASLTTGMSAGTAYLNGVRTIVAAVSSYAFPASSDTYVSFDNAGTPAYQSVANGTTAPTPASGYVQTAKVVTSPIQSPTPTLAAGTSGSLASGTYQVALVAYDATGYGAVGASGSVTVAASGSIDISWVNPLNETSMDIYATTAGNTTLGLVASGVTGNTYTYTGSVAPGVAPTTVATSNAVQVISPIINTAPDFEFQPSIPFATKFSITRRLSMDVSVDYFGADPSGVLDSTNAITTAVEEALYSGKRLVLSAGYYIISNVISTTQVGNLVITGAGRSNSIITNTSSNASIFNLGTTPIEMSDFTVSGYGTPTAGSLIQSSGTIHLSRMSIENYYNGLTIDGNVGTISNLEFHNPLSSSSNGMMINGFGGGLAIDRVIMYVPNVTPNSGIFIQSCGAVQISNSNIIKQNSNLLLQPGNGQTVASVMATNTYFDSAQFCNINISPLAGGSVVRTYIAQCEASSSSGTGIAIYAGSGTINGVMIASAQANFCAGNGIEVVGSGVSNVDIIGGQAGGNGGSGLSITNGASGVRVLSLTAGAGYGAGGNIYGIYTDGTTIGLEITASSCTGNTTNNIAAPEATLVGCPGYPSNVVAGTAASGATNKGQTDSLYQLSTLAVSSTTTAGPITATAAQLSGGYLADGATQTAAFTVTTDTAANILAAMPNAAVGTSFKFRFINNDQSSTGYAGTLAGGTGVTVGSVIPNPAVPKGGYEDYLFTFTAIGSTPTLTVEAIGGNSAALL